MPGSQLAKAFEINPSLLAFRPRQVALLSKPPNMELDNAETLVLKPDQKALLFRSIAQFLQRSGFSKTVKKFLSEAEIQKDDLGDSSYDLEEIFCKFLNICNDSKNSKSHKVKDGGVDDTSAIDTPVDGKKKSDKASKSENVADEVDVKSKQKKRNKKDTYTLVQEQVSTKSLEETSNGVKDESKEEKKKKKEKNKRSSDPVTDEEKPNKNEIQSSREDETETENKSTKKRKRVASEDVQAACENVVEESKNKKKEKSKRRKTEGSEKAEEESKELKLTTESDEKARKEENNQACPDESQKTIAEQVNGSLEKSGEKSSIKKTMKKEQNGSAEPKTVKHFQRVKVDEVVFSDERLKNNSYWAKDGAEIGYGAKAQEILEQVRGRNFRHEKTKKKRGSYRGGQIDLQSHSVKFNYSDEE